MAVSATWQRAPSSYLGLTGLHAYWLDEAAAELLAQRRSRQAAEPEETDDIL